MEQIKTVAPPAVKPVEAAPPVIAPPAVDQAGPKTPGAAPTDAATDRVVPKISTVAPTGVGVPTTDEAAAEIFSLYAGAGPVESLLRAAPTPQQFVAAMDRARSNGVPRNVVVAAANQLNLRYALRLLGEEED